MGIFNFVVAKFTDKPPFLWHGLHMVTTVEAGCCWYCKAVTMVLMPPAHHHVVEHHPELS